MTRKELIERIETIGQESAKDFPEVSELLELLFCLLHWEKEGWMTQVVNLCLWQERAVAQDIEAEHAE